MEPTPASVTLFSVIAAGVIVAVMIPLAIVATMVLAHLIVLIG